MICILVFSIIRKNGFALEEDLHAPPGQRFKLKAVPFSKNITFGVEGNPFETKLWYVDYKIFKHAAIIQ